VSESIPHQSARALVIVARSLQAGILPGIGDSDLADPADRVFAFDYSGSGRLGRAFADSWAEGAACLGRGRPRTGDVHQPAYADLNLVGCEE